MENPPPVYCNQCGQPNRPGARFCARCGTALAERPAPPPPPLPPPQPLPVRRRANGVLWGLGGLLLLAAIVAGLWLTNNGGLLALFATPTPTPRPLAAFATQAGEVVAAARTRSGEVVTQVGGRIAAAGTRVAGAVGGRVAQAQTRAAELVLTLPPPDLNGGGDDGDSSGDAVRIPGTEIELPRMTDAQEVAIGRAAHAEMLGELRVLDDRDQLRRVQAIGDAIVPFTLRPDLPYTYTLLDDPMVNAFALPGGYIYLTAGMLDFIGGDDDQLAAVIGHELAHVGRRHAAKRVEVLTAAQYVLELLAQDRAQLGEIYERESAQIAALATANILVSGWGRGQELDADEVGAVTMAAAGFDARAAIVLFERMALAFPAGSPGRAERLLRTHPPFAERVERLERVVAGLE